MNTNAAKRNGIEVLLVDDHRFVATVVQSLLARELDITLHHCAHAAEAVARAIEIAPTIILQDLVMPDIDGLTLVKAYRDNAVTAHTPIVVLSGNDDALSRAQARAAGATDYMVKLPAQDDLIASIRRHAAVGGAPSLELVADCPADDEDGEDTLDPAVTASFRPRAPGDSPAFALALIDQFVEEAEGRVAALRDATERRDAAALGIMAHSLKGSALIMGATRLAALCEKIESGAKDPADRTIAGTLMPIVDAELARVRAAFSKERRGIAHAAAPALRVVSS